MSAPTRRGLLAGAAVLTAAPVAANPTPATIRNPDGTWPASLFPPGRHPRADWQPGAAVPDEPDDAALIAACAAFDTLERASLATFTGYENDTPGEAAADVERDRLHRLQLPLVDRICELRAVTRQGQAARARSLALWEADDTSGNLNSTYINERLLGAILRDVLA